MTRSERIKSFSKGYEKLSATIKKFPKALWNFKPAPKKWSVHEILVHMADSEANGYCHLRKMIAEPGSKIYTYDQDKWAVKLNYSLHNYKDALELFKLLRKMNYNIIKNLHAGTWKNYIHHPVHGKMNLDDWLKMYDEHVTIHINQMKRNLAAWQKSKR